MNNPHPTIKKVPVKFQDDRGEIIEVLKGIQGRQLNILITKKGAVRGNHYHYKKDEYFYILKGSVKFVFADKQGGNISEHECGQGTLIGIPAGLAHAFIGLSQDSRLIEYQNTEYNPDKPDVEIVNLL